MAEHGLACDITEVAGIDDIHAPYDQCQKAQALAAELYGADHSYFLVNGSTVGNQAMMLSCLAPGETVLMPDASHRSAFGALLLSGAKAHTFKTSLHPELLCSLPPTPEQLVAAHWRAPEARALFFTTPTYHGAIGQTTALIDTARKLGLLVLVDAAWGSHLVAPKGDLVVQSVHKLTPALTQSAILHLNGDRIDKARLEVVLRHLQTSSPSSLLVASIDCARRYLALHGEELTEQIAKLSTRALETLATIPGCRATRLDCPTRLIVGMRGWSGQALAEELRRHRIRVEMSEPHQVLFVLTAGHTESDIDRLGEALGSLPEGKTAPDFAHLRETYEELHDESVPSLTIREAFFSPQETVSLEASVGRISAELLYAYPPGVPLVYPGQRFTDTKLEHIRTHRRLGGCVQGGSDPSLETVLIIKRQG